MDIDPLDADNNNDPEIPRTRDRARLLQWMNKHVLETGALAGLPSRPVVDIDDQYGLVRAMEESDASTPLTEAEQRQWDEILLIADENAAFNLVYDFADYVIKKHPGDTSFSREDLSGFLVALDKKAGNRPESIERANFRCQRMIGLLSSENKERMPSGPFIRKSEKDPSRYDFTTEGIEAMFDVGQYDEDF